MISKILLSSLLVVALTGCSLFPKVQQIETVKTAIEKPKLNLSDPDALKLKEVKWIVVTRDNAEQIFAELEKSGKPIALFGMTTDSYEALALNMNDIKAYLVTQKQILIKYREYYEGETDGTEEVE